MKDLSYRVDLYTGDNVYFLEINFKNEQIVGQLNTDYFEDLRVRNAKKVAVACACVGIHVAEKPSFRRQKYVLTLGSDTCQNSVSLIHSIDQSSLYLRFWLCTSIY